MSQFPPNQSFDSPVYPGQSMYISRRTAWPTVLGVISIILGSLGILVNLCGVGSGFIAGATKSMMKSAIQQAPQEQKEQFEKIFVQIMQIMAKVGIYQSILCFIFLVLAILLLIAGIGLMQRGQYGVTLTRWWAVLKIVAVVGSIALGIYTMKLQNQAMVTMIEQMPQKESKPPVDMRMMMQSMQSSMYVFQIMLGIVIGWSYPIFCLIWLNRPKIRQETDRWNGSAASNTQVSL